MKHVFIVNSHTTFLSSLGVIDLLNIPDKDVVLLFARNYKNSIYKLPYKTFNVDNLYYSSEIVYKTNDQGKILEKVAEVKNVINKVIDGFFHLYVPNFCNPFVCLLYSSWKCRRISFIQEAAQSVVKSYIADITIWKAIKRSIKIILGIIPYWKRINPCYYRNDYLFFKQKSMYTYAINNKIFEGFNAVNRIIRWPIIPINSQLDYSAAFFIVDGWVQNKMCEKDVFLSLMYKLIQENALSKNYIKFHPNQTDEEKEIIINYFQELDFRYEILDSSIPFELIITSTQNLKIIGMGSALCFFAKDLNHNVVCHDDWCYEKSKLFKQHIQRTGNILYKNLYKTT